jgi:hypothetical protein
LKAPARPPGPSSDIGPSRGREQQPRTASCRPDGASRDDQRNRLAALIDVEVILKDAPIATFEALDIDDVPDEIDIGGQRFRVTVHVGPLCQPSGRPLYVLLVEPGQAATAPAKDPAETSGIAAESVSEPARSPG